MTKPSPRAFQALLIKIAVLVGVSSLTALLLFMADFSTEQALSTSVLLAAILGTLLFWEARLSVVFVGVSLLLLSRTLRLDQMILYSSVDVIVFLVGMMILTAAVDELGLFSWLVYLVIHQKRNSGRMIILQLCVISAILSCVIGEVSSIIVMIAIIFQLCNHVKVNPIPFVIMSVMCTNIGSAGTMLGNPIGILIGLRAGLTFEDFILNAFPITIGLLVITMLILFLWYRKPIKEFDTKLKEYLLEESAGTCTLPAPRLSLKAVLVFIIPLCLIALHYRLEKLLDLQKNTILVAVPLVFAGIVLLWRRERAQDYVEKCVHWSTMLFFLFLFVLSGMLGSTGVAQKIASFIIKLAGQEPIVILGLLLITSGVLSAFLDNVVAIATFIPVVSSLESAGVNVSPLWWALLFGGCLGGNITMIGSTANIVALGTLEKSQNLSVRFFDWLKIGLFVGIVTILLSGVGILLLSSR